MLYVIMGKSATGKDTIYKKLIENKKLNLHKLVPYTTRPMRTGEIEGNEYHFVSEDRMKELKNEGKIAEFRCYHTVYGDWYYFTADDGADIRNAAIRYITIGTLEAYISLRKYYGTENVVPIYITVEDFERMRRSLEREKSQPCPSCKEVCRRFLADEEDFADEKLGNAGIDVHYENIDLDTCVYTISKMMEVR